MTDRLSRWERAKAPARIVLQARDREIMVALFTMRLLTREQVQRLFGLKCTRRLNFRLRRLYDHGYLNRQFLPTARGSGQAVYSLGPLGLPVIAVELSLDPGAIRSRIKKTGNLGELFLNHALELNDVRIAFSQAIQKREGFRLERWLGDSECEEAYEMVINGRRVTKRFRPDGYFRIWRQTTLVSFFVELDRSTMSLGRFQGKARVYLEFRNQGYYQERFGVRYFRVLVITLTQERLRNLKEAVEEITGEAFWFTTLDQIRADTVFSTIWQRVGRQGLFPLIRE